MAQCKLRVMDLVRAKQFGALIAVASLGLTALANSALAGKMDALLGDWDLNIAKSKFEPKPPMKKYTMKYRCRHGASARQKRLDRG